MAVAATFAADFDATAYRADAAFYAADAARGAATTAFYADDEADAGLAGAGTGVAAAGAIASISHETATVADAARADDLTAVAAGLNPADLVSQPLWLEGPPQRFVELWRALKDRLRSLDEGWDVWTDWYEARLEGWSANETLEVARATIADEVWKEGPRTVNAHIRELIDSPHDPAPLPPPDGSPQPRRNVWLAKYTREKDQPNQWMRAIGPGSPIPWKIVKADIAAMRAGDPVVYFRNVKGRDRGGVVGTGKIASTELITDKDGQVRVPTEVAEFYADKPLNRDDVIEATGLKPTKRHFKQLSPDVAGKMDAHLRENGRQGIVDDETQARLSRSRHETEYVSDRPETARDLLGRAPLAFALAAQINRIWDAQTKGEVQPGRWRRLCDALHITRASRPSSQQDEAAFILHIDAPWGGGKTTFANFIGRILNPAAFGLDESAEGVAFLEGLPLDDDALWKPEYRRRRWHVVQFNAWQHEHVSPPWWNFYEVIRRQCLKGLVRSRSANAAALRLILAGAWDRLRRLGSEPNSASAATLRLTLAGAWDRLRRLGSDLRLASVALLRLILVGGWNQLRRRGRWLWFVLREVAWRIWSPATRRAVVTTLLLGVVTFFVYWSGLYDWLEKQEISGVKVSTVATAIASGGIGLLIFGAVRSGLSTFVKSVSSSADAASLGEADPLDRFQTHFSRFVRQLDEPVLVIVDDIDRCKPEYVVELVRGLLTIFRSPRVVFLLLGDKTWIETAFAHVHASMAKADTDARISFGGRFAEKAIQLSFILPEATEAERNVYLVAVLTGKIADRRHGPGDYQGR